MKKNLKFLTGIVFFIAILAACASIPEVNNGTQPRSWEELDTVIIYLKAIEINGVHHLEMYDSNDKTKKEIDSLHTLVRDSTVVFWTVADQSGIKKIKKISPKKGPGKIIPGDATGFLTPKKKKLKIPDGQTFGDEEEYLIKIKDTNGDIWTIDPHLKIPDQR